MNILNLVYPENSDIKYKISKFPDGQQNIVIDNSRGALSKKLYLDKEQYSFEIPIEAVQIKSRLNNWLDLELIICAVASLRELGVEEIHLYTPYIMGARSDRKFEEGGNNYLRDVICPIINSLNFKTVTCIDPHSDVLEACIKNFRKESNWEVVKWALCNHINTTHLYKGDGYILISPDGGSLKKIYKLAEQIGYKRNIITCSKDRDTEGKLTKTVIPVSTIVHTDYIIIDDICDGGGTFINIAKILKPRLHSSNRLFLIVTHGIFSKGFEELSKYFDGIYCTNSYGTISAEDAKELKQASIVKQLNVF